MVCWFVGREGLVEEGAAGGNRLLLWGEMGAGAVGAVVGWAKIGALTLSEFRKSSHELRRSHVLPKDGPLKQE